MQVLSEASRFVANTICKILDRLFHNFPVVHHDMQAEEARQRIKDFLAIVWGVPKRALDFARLGNKTTQGVGRTGNAPCERIRDSCSIPEFSTALKSDVDLSVYFNTSLKCKHGGDRETANTTDQSYVLVAPMYLDQLLAHRPKPEVMRSRPDSRQMCFLHAVVSFTNRLCVGLMYDPRPIELVFVGFSALMTANHVMEYVCARVLSVSGIVPTVRLDTLLGLDTRLPNYSGRAVFIVFGRVTDHESANALISSLGPNQMISVNVAVEALRSILIPSTCSMLLPICSGPRTEHLTVQKVGRPADFDPDMVDGKLAYYDLCIRGYRISCGRCRDCSIARVSVSHISTCYGYLPTHQDVVAEELEFSVPKS